MFCKKINAIVGANLNGPFYGLKFVVNEILKEGGVIVNTASLGGLVRIPALGANELGLFRH